MKIITDFKDFYDYGMAFGVDEGIVYERFQKTIYPPKNLTNRNGSILGFCGEYWEVTIFYNEPKSYRRNSLKDKKKVKNYLEDGWVAATVVMDRVFKDKIDYQYFIRPLDLMNKEWNYGYGSWNRKNYTPWKNWVRSIFTEHNVPSFYIDGIEDYKTTLNPVTMDYGLQKMLDPVEAFQKLSTFIPSLKPEDTFEMTDEQKGRSKGFDEFSFRHKNTKNKPKKF